MNDINYNSQHKVRFSIGRIDNFLHNLHTKRSGLNKVLTIGASLIIYAAVILIFGNKLKISGNYFVVIPLIAVSFTFGFKGGVPAGFLALPLNLFMFHLLGHREYSPENKLIAELTGLIIGSVLGYGSDYYNEIEFEISRRRIAEEKLQQSLREKEILIHEIHHRVKNNLNIVKSLIQLQINRSEDPGFKYEAQKLIKRVYSIARVHEHLYKGNKVTEPSLGEYIPTLINDILAGLDESSLVVKYGIDIPEIKISIEQATSLGLIINEVLTNAIKYSLCLVESPTLEVVIKPEAERIIIELINNAPTFIPKGDDYHGLGLKLITTLSEQLDAEYAYVPGHGTTFRLIMPVDQGCRY